MGRHVFVERDLGVAVPATPEPMAIPRLVDSDPVNPGPQARPAAKAVDGAEDAQKDFLAKIQRFVAIAKKIHGQLDDHPLVFGHEFRTGGLVALRTALHDRRFSAADVQPTGDTCLLHREFPKRWRHEKGDSFKYTES